LILKNKVVASQPDPEKTEYSLQIAVRSVAVRTLESYAAGSES